MIDSTCRTSSLFARWTSLAVPFSLLPRWQYRKIEMMAMMAMAISKWFWTMADWWKTLQSPSQTHQYFDLSKKLCFFYWWIRRLCFLPLPCPHSRQSRSNDWAKGKRGQPEPGWDFATESIDTRECGGKSIMYESHYSWWHRQVETQKKVCWCTKSSWRVMVTWVSDEWFDAKLRSEKLSNYAIFRSPKHYSIFSPGFTVVTFSFAFSVSYILL